MIKWSGEEFVEEVEEKKKQSFEEAIEVYRETDDKLKVQKYRLLCTKEIADRRVTALSAARGRSTDC